MDTYNFIDQLDISYLHVFTYSERENTKALKLSPIVPKHIRIERSKKLHALSEIKRGYFYDSFVGKEKYALFESMKNGKIVGYTDNYIKIYVDGDMSLINTVQKINIIERESKYMRANLN